MSDNPVVQLDDLYKEFVAGRLDRRALMLRAGGLGISAAALSVFFRGIPVSAQAATPIATGKLFKSLTREEYKTILQGAYPFVKDPGAASTGGTVILGDLASSNLTSFNGILASDSPTLDVMQLVHETLVGSSPIDGAYVPGLADRWEISADGKVYTYFLHPGVKWHDGKPFTADDVIFSFDAQKNPDTGSAYTGSFVGSVASYRKTDDLTVEVTAVDVFSPLVFFGNSYCPIIPKHIWESIPPKNWKSDSASNGQDPARVVGTGILKFKNVDASRGTATFVKNADYYDDKLIVDEFIFATWPDETSEVEALRAGNIDIIDDVPSPEVKGLQTPDKGTDVLLQPSYSFGWFGFQLDPAKSPLFQDVRVRHAMIYALNRQSMVDNLLLGYGEVAQGSQPSLSPAYSPESITTKYTYDVAKSKSLLAEAGWVAGGDGIVAKDGKKLSFEIMYGAASSNDAIAAAAQDFWKAVGIDAKPSPVDFGTVLVPALTENFNFQLVMLAFNWDATGDQSAMFASDQHGSGFNAMNYKNPKVDAAFAAAKRELDDKKRVELLIAATNLVNEDLPVIINWFRSKRYAYQTRLQNFKPNAKGGLLWTLPYVWIKK